MDDRRYIVEWAPAARQDLRHIARYLARDSISAARNVAKRIRARVESLAELPERGRRIPELAVHGLSSEREIVASPYRVVYSIGRERVRILAVLDGRRDLEDLLLERLIEGARP